MGGYKDLCFYVIVKSSRTFISSSNVDFISELHRRGYEDEENDWDWTNLLLDEECRMWLKMQYWDSSGLCGPVRGPSQHPDKIFSCRKCPPYRNHGPLMAWARVNCKLCLFITPLISLLITSTGAEEKTVKGIRDESPRDDYFQRPLSSEKSYLIQTFTSFCSPI